MTNETGNNSPEDIELRELVAAESGKLANQAADASLLAVSLLGAMPEGSEADPRYRNEICAGLTRVLCALQGVERCIRAANPDANDGQRVALVAAALGKLLNADGGAVLAELLEDASHA